MYDHVAEKKFTFAISSPDEFLVSYRVISATQQNSLLRKVSKECVAHPLLVSYSQNSRERVVMYGFSKMFQFTENDCNGVVTTRIGGRVHHFTMDQF